MINGYDYVYFNHIRYMYAAGNGKLWFLDSGGWWKIVPDSNLKTGVIIAMGHTPPKKSIEQKFMEAF